METAQQTSEMLLQWVGHQKVASASVATLCCDLDFVEADIIMFHELITCADFETAEDYYTSVQKRINDGRCGKVFSTAGSDGKDGADGNNGPDVEFSTSLILVPCRFADSKPKKTLGEPWARFHGLSRPAW